jgi:hypothetical protein
MTQGKPHTLAPEECFLPVKWIAPQPYNYSFIRTNESTENRFVNRQTTFAFRCEALCVEDEDYTSSVEAFPPLAVEASRS